MKLKRKLLWFSILFFLFLTVLPYLGYFDLPVFIGGFPTALALILFSNVILTICSILIYPLYYKPFIRKLSEQPIVKEDI